MPVTFSLTVEYSTIAVFDTNMAGDFNEWSSRHWEQGFSWREGDVSFRPLSGFGVTEVEVVEANNLNLAPETERAILVPFTTTGQVRIASINYGETIAIPPGEYSLIFENILTGEEQMWCRLTFIPAQEPVQTQILKADPDLSPTYPLLMEAHPA